MTPPEEIGQGIIAKAPINLPAVSLCIKTMQTRPEFLRAASARRQGAGGFLLYCVKENRQCRSPQPGKAEITGRGAGGSARLCRPRMGLRSGGPPGRDG